MGELLDLFDKTVERVRREDAQYDMESAPNPQSPIPNPH